jgi:hypothetical protein
MSNHLIVANYKSVIKYEVMKLSLLKNIEKVISGQAIILIVWY